MQSDLHSALVPGSWAMPMIARLMSMPARVSGGAELPIEAGSHFEPTPSAAEGPKSRPGSNLFPV